MSIRDTLLSRKNIKQVSIEETTYYLRQLTALERIQLSEFAKQHAANNDKITARMLSYSLVEADGSRCFSEGDEALTLTLPGPLVDDLIVAILEHNGMKADAVEDAEKN